MLDRSHITRHTNQAVDEVRLAETTRLWAKSNNEARQLKNMRWPLLRKANRMRRRARKKFNALLARKLAMARTWELKEVFLHFWTYKSPLWAAGFLDAWCDRTQRSCLDPMQKVARLLRNYEELTLNWSCAKGELASVAVKSLNSKFHAVTRISFGFCIFKAIKMADIIPLALDPESAHRFF